ncbi:MAG TPA: hypothetical protein VF787_03430 [Thermoanaerobaculia bacterium]
MAGRARKKTAGESAAPGKVKQPHGGELLTGGVPGNKGGTGRPPDKFKAMCRELASSADVEREVKKILKKGSKDPMFVPALRWATEHGYGKASQAVTLEVGETLEELIVGSMGIRKQAPAE